MSTHNIHKTYETLPSHTFYDCNYTAWVPHGPYRTPRQPTRIGAESQNGEVYLSKFQTAIKLINANRPYALREVQLTAKLSESQKEWYPRVVSTGTCSISSMHKNSQIFLSSFAPHQAFFIEQELLYITVKQWLSLEAVPSSLPLYDTYYIFHQLIEAVYDLNYVRGVAHNDLHLNNVMLDLKGRVVLIDFGSATVFHPEHDAYSDLMCFLEHLITFSEAFNEVGHPFYAYVEACQLSDVPYNVVELQRKLTRLTKCYCANLKWSKEIRID